MIAEHSIREALNLPTPQQSERLRAEAVRQEALKRVQQAIQRVNTRAIAKAQQAARQATTEALRAGVGR